MQEISKRKVVKVNRKFAGDNIERRAHEIYLLAAQIFSEKGFDATSVNDIAEATGLTKAGLYHYIESKQDLLFRIMQLGLDIAEKEVIIPAREIEDPEKRLEFIINNHVRLVASGNQMAIMVSSEVAALEPNQREVVNKRRRVFTGLISETLTELKCKGRLRDVNITTATFSIVGIVLIIPRWFSENGLLTVEEVSKDICRIALGGLLVTQ